MVREIDLSQLRKGVLQYCVLALVVESERYAFEIVRELGRVDGLVTSEGTIYPLLSRLRREGLVETTWQESASGPPRRYYRATPAGQASLAAFSDQWQRFRDAVDVMITERTRH